MDKLFLGIAETGHLAITTYEIGARFTSLVSHAANSCRHAVYDRRVLVVHCASI